MTPVKITLYRWAGHWGPFKIKVPCGECALTQDIIEDTLIAELEEIPAELETHNWLSQWWSPLCRGGWHAPIVLVENRVICQGTALNRGILTQAVIEAYAKRTPIRGSHLFGKSTCPHCHRARNYLEQTNQPYRYHDVVKDPIALYEMLARIKPLVGKKIPITVPQIWLDGHYIGGADQLSQQLQLSVEPNYDRGQCSLSPKSSLR